MSKIPDQKLREHIAKMMADRKDRKFQETVDLQIGLKDYDPNKDKRFVGSVKLPNIPRPRMKTCFIADAAHIDKCKALGIEYIDADTLKLKINPADKKGKDLKKWSKKYRMLFVSDTLLKHLPKLGGPLFTKWGKFPIVVTTTDNVRARVDEGLATIKYQLKKVTNLGVAIGHVGLSEEEIRQNLLMSINFLISLLKKGWTNISALTIRTTMGKPVKIY
jgi:large subunit ribosomal protein L10Ae